MANQGYWEKSRTHQFVALVKRLLRPSNLVATNLPQAGYVPSVGADDQFTWVAGGGGGGTGTVTSIDGSGGATGLTLTGGPITTAGTLTLGGTLDIDNGGTGQTTAQLAINALSQVSGATNEYVLTKDTATGNALFKPAAGGSGGPYITGLATTVNAGDGYSWTPTLNSDGGATSVRWEVTEGTDPAGSEPFPGVFQDPFTGEISGIPTTPGDLPFEIAVTLLDGSSAGATAYSRQIVDVVGIGILPSAVASCTGWWDATYAPSLWQDQAATSPAASGGDNVRRWLSRAGTKSLTNNVGFPTLQTAVVNGNNTVRFLTAGGVGLYTAPAGSTTPDPASNYFTAALNTRVYCLRVTSASTTGTAYNTGGRFMLDSGQYIGDFVSTSPDRYFTYNWDGSADYANVAESLSAFVIVSVQHIGGNIRVRVDRGSWATVASGNTTNLGNYINILFNNGGTGSYADIQQIAFFNDAIGSTDLEGVEDYFASVAGITL